MWYNVSRYLIVAHIYEKGEGLMANFAVSCSDEIIERGNRLLAKMAEGTDEKKGETLNRLFEFVEKGIGDATMQANGVDTRALDAALNDIRTMFESVSSSRERLLAEKDQQIEQLKADKAAMKTACDNQIQTAVAEKEAAAQAAEKAVKDADTAQKQADTASSLAAEKEKINIMLTAKLAEAESKLSGYDDLKASELAAREQIAEFQRKITQMEKDHFAEISGMKKDADIAKERAVTEKEWEMQDKIQTAELEAAKMSGKIEILEARIQELTKLVKSEHESVNTEMA